MNTTNLGSQAMMNVSPVRDSLHLFVQLAACLAFGTACSDEASDPDARATDGARVCRECVSVEPGQGSSATAGFQAACVLAYLERSVDRAEAESLGFPVTAGAALIERPIDTPMTWVPQQSEGGGPAAGYQRKTRIRGGFNVESYKYSWLDPTRCDGTTCKLDDQATTEQAPCPERYLMIQVSGALETLDRAIAAQFPTQDVNMRLPGQTDDLVVAASADLSEVRGSLTIDPDAPPPRVGRLDLSLQFADGEHREFGVLSVSVTPDWDNLSDGARSDRAGRLAYYAPIEARWGDFPTGKPSTSPAD